MPAGRGARGWAPPATFAASGSTELHTLALTMSAGQWATLTVSGLVTTLFTGAGFTTLGYLDKACYDPTRKQVRFIGQGHLQDQRYHQYDETTNTFSNLDDPSWDDGGSGKPSWIGHGYQHNAMDPATGDHYYRITGSSTIHRLTRSSGVWDTIAAPTVPGTPISGALEWLPEIGTQGGLIFSSGSASVQVQRWDKAGNSWSNVGSISARSNHSVAVRSIPNSLVLLGGGNHEPQLWSVGASGGLTARTDCPISFGINATITTACPTSGDLLVFAPGGSGYSYSVSSGNWTALSGVPNFGVDPDDVFAVPIPYAGVVLVVDGAATVARLYKHA